MRRLIATIAVSLALAGVALAAQTATSDAAEASSSDPGPREYIDNLDIFIL